MKILNDLQASPKGIQIPKKENSKFQKRAKRSIPIAIRIGKLKQISTIKTSKIATLDKTLVLGKIGQIDSSDLHKVNESLFVLFRIHS